MPTIGRPCELNEEISALLCRRVSMGELITKICLEPDMPGLSTVFDWLREVPAFSAAYAQARLLQADVFAEEIVSLSDECRVGEKVEIREDVTGITRKVITGDMVERSKLQVSARQWVAARQSPAKYGDRIAHQMLDEHGKPARAGVTVIIDGAPGDKAAE